MTTAGVFTWTPREADGGEARTFTVMVTDNVGTPPVNVNTEFTITADELPNRPPTGATLTVAGGVTSVTNPSTLDLTAAATDPDTGDMLTYTWSSSASGDTFDPATGASTTWTYTPPTVMAATMVTLTVTVTDSTDGSVTATHMITVNPPDTAPAFSSGAMVPAQTYTMGTAITPLTLPVVETPGNGATTYTLTPALPTGLTFDATANPPTITGMPTTVAVATMYTYTAADGDMNTATDDTATLPFSITVNAAAESVDLAVSLGADQTVEPGAQITVTGTVAGANSPNSGLTIAWELLDAGPISTILGGVEVARLGGIIATNSGLTLTFPATTAAVLAAATPAQDSWVLGIRIRVTDPMAAAGQMPVTDDIAVTIMAAPAPTPPSSQTLTLESDDGRGIRDAHGHHRHGHPERRHICHSAALLF